MTRGGNGDGAVHCFCGAQPDGETSNHAQERGSDGSDGALAAPEDCEGGGEDAGACEDTCELLSEPFMLLVLRDRSDGPSMYNVQPRSTPT